MLRRALRVNGCPTAGLQDPTNASK